MIDILAHYICAQHSKHIVKLLCSRTAVGSVCKIGGGLHRVFRQQNFIGFLFLLFLYLSLFVSEDQPFQVLAFVGLCIKPLQRLCIFQRKLKSKTPDAVPVIFLRGSSVFVSLFI